MKTTIIHNKNEWNTLKMNVDNIEIGIAFVNKTDMDIRMMIHVLRVSLQIWRMSWFNPEYFVDAVEVYENNDNIIDIEYCYHSEKIVNELQLKNAVINIHWKEL